MTFRHLYWAVVLALLEILASSGGAVARELTDDLAALERGTLADLRSFLERYPATAMTGRGRTALMIVAGWPGEERGAAAELLLEVGVPVNAVDGSGQTALSIAASRRDASLVRRLLAAGARVDIGHPLISAITPVSSTDGDLHATVEALLAGGALADECDSHRRRALQRAAAVGQDGVVRLLLASGADPEAPDPTTGDPPLHSAALRGSHDAVLALLASGAPVDAQNPYDCSTALHRAAAAGHKEVVEVLLRAEAAINKTEHRGDTAWELAVRGGHRRVAELLQQAGGSSATLRTEACAGDAARERRPCAPPESTIDDPEAIVDGDFHGALQRVEEIVAAWEAEHQTMVASEIVLEIQSNLAYAAGMLCTGLGPFEADRPSPCRAFMAGGPGLRHPVGDYLSSTLLERRATVDSPFSRFADSLGVDDHSLGYSSPQPNRSACVELPAPAHVEFPILGGSKDSSGPITRVCILPGDYEILATTDLGSKAYKISALPRRAWLTETARDMAFATSVLPALDVYCLDPAGKVNHPVAAYRGRDARPTPLDEAAPFAQSPVGRIDIVDTLDDCNESCQHALGLSLVQSIQVWLGACESCSPSSLRALGIGGRIFLDRVLLDRLLFAEDLAKAFATATPILEEGSLHMNRFSVGGRPRPRKPFPPYVEVLAGSALSSTLCERLAGAKGDVERQLRSLLCRGPSPGSATEAPLQVRIVARASCVPDAIACATVDQAISLNAGGYRFRPSTTSASQGRAGAHVGSGEVEVDLLPVLIHEVGHWFGVPHLDDPRPTADGRVNAMHPRLLPQGLCVTPANMQMLDNASRPEWYFRQSACAGLLSGRD